MANIMGSRYFKVNLMSFQRHGTIEFRQHSGTVNATKIANWVRFLGQFIDNSKARNTPAVSAPVIEHPALHGVQARLSEMFTSQGVVSLSAMCVLSAGCPIPLGLRLPGCVVWACRLNRCAGSQHTVS